MMWLCPVEDCDSAIEDGSEVVQPAAIRDPANRIGWHHITVSRCGKGHVFEVQHALDEPALPPTLADLSRAKPLRFGE